MPHLGWIVYEAQDEVATLLRQGHFEAPEQAFFWLYLREGDRFLDCGAHAGLYSVLASLAIGDGGMIVSMEPNPSTSSRLALNLSRRGLDRVKILRAAAWSQVGHLNFSLEQSGRAAYCHVVAMTSPDSVSVSATTLTEVAKEFHGKSCCLTKIDTEGAEIEVLKGGRQAIQAGNYPLLMVEFNEHNLRLNGDTTEKLFDLLTDLGYKVLRFNPDSMRLEPASFTGEIWYENLFAALDPDGVNLRLSSASDQRLRIANEIIERGRACNKFQELEELANYKQQALQAEAATRWAQQSDTNLSEVKADLNSTKAKLLELESILSRNAITLEHFNQLKRHWLVRFGENFGILRRSEFSSPERRETR